MFSFFRRARDDDAELTPLANSSSSLSAQSVPSLADKFAVTIENVLSEEECADWIRITEARGFDVALVGTDKGQELIQDYRHSSRCIIDDAERANELYLRIRSFIPRELHFNGKRWYVAGLNERLRFLKYDPGDFFAPHMDGVFCRTIGEGAKNAADPRLNEISLVTVQLYLNGGFTGGETSFFPRGREDIDEQDKIRVVPLPGLVLLFEHRILHEGSLLRAGVKYAMRTDVMYTTRGPDYEYVDNSKESDF